MEKKDIQKGLNVQWYCSNGNYINGKVHDIQGDLAVVITPTGSRRWVRIDVLEKVN